MSASQTIAMNQKSNDLKAQGVDVINLSVGEPDFPTPEHIKQAAKEAIDANYSFYPPVAGYPDLKKAIARKFKVENNLDYSPDQIVVSCGAKHCLANVILTVIDPGDEVIIPAPYWVSYIEQVKLAEGIGIVVETGIEDQFKMSPEKLEAAITQRTKALMICSPSNPTGAVYSRTELQNLVTVLERYPDVLVITDEIYEHINFVGSHTSIAEFPSIKDRVVVINGVSKAYAMTGWRIGYMAAPGWITSECVKLQGQTTTGATTIAQRAALTALTADQSCVSEMNKAFLRRRDLIMNRISRMKGVKCAVPDGAFYIFPDMSSFYGTEFNGTKINGSMDLCLYLLGEGHIATVPGEAFGAEKCIRISYANSDENLVRAMDRLENALTCLK